jgi:hypothetical protein
MQAIVSLADFQLTRMTPTLRSCRVPLVNIN